MYLFLCGRMSAVAFLWRSEDIRRSQFFPSIVCFGDQTQVIRCGSKYPHLMSHLPGPISITLKSQFPYLGSEQEWRPLGEGVTTG